MKLKHLIPAVFLAFGSDGLMTAYSASPLAAPEGGSACEINGPLAFSWREYLMDFQANSIRREEDGSVTGLKVEYVAVETPSEFGSGVRMVPVVRRETLPPALQCQ